MTGNMLTYSSKFEGALVAALIGDCLGGKFEKLWDLVTPEIVKHYFNSSGDAYHLKEKDENINRCPYTDDTAFAKDVASSLLEMKCFDPENMARKLTTTFFAEPDRYYGGHIGAVFENLRRQNYQDPFGPAKEQFHGSGSYGNGGPMRIAPAALFYLKAEEKQFEDEVASITKLTHSHADAIVGSQLLAHAVRIALRNDGQKLDASQFVADLLRIAQRLESKDGSQHSSSILDVKNPEKSFKSYTEKLAYIQEIFSDSSSNPSRKDIVKILGHDVTALGSVPTAIYSFLRCQHQLDILETDNPIVRTIVYAISLGGDTDTIATMAGAIAGAFYGIEDVPKYWVKMCEDLESIRMLSKQLYHHVFPDE